MEAEKKQKILLVHNFYQIPGGEDTVVANEMKMLQKHGHEVVLYTRNNSELKEFSKLRKLMLPFTTVFNPQTYKEIKRIIQEEKIDIVHVHNTLNLISPAVYYAARSCHVPVVQTVHNFRLLCPGATFYRDGHICEECMERGLHCAVKYGCYRGSKIQTLACAFTTWFHRMTRIYGNINYICLTEFNREKLLMLKQIRPNRVFVKPNFVDSADTEMIPYEHRENQYIFAGRLDKLKGINILLEAWKKMGERAPKLLICGTGPMEGWCQEYIAQNHLKTIEMKDFVPNHEVKKRIGQSKALILPTQLYEGFPMTIVEAYSVGTPVLCSDLGNAGSAVEEGITGYKFAPESPASIAEAVSQLENSDIDSTVITEIYIKKYSSEQNYLMLEDIYHKAF